MPLFISLEGPDGSGKSTQARLLVTALQHRGFEVTATREPGGTPLGDRVRDLVLDPASPQATPLAVTFLLSAARAEHVADVIRPALARGHFVVSDRFADSTLAYQSYGQGVNVDDVRVLTAIATGGLQPDVTVYVDVPVEIGLQRIAARGGLNRLDALALETHRNVRDGYLALIAEQPQRWIVVDGTRSEEEVHRAILASLSTLLETVGDPV